MIDEKIKISVTVAIASAVIIQAAEKVIHTSIRSNISGSSCTYTRILESCIEVTIERRMT